MCPASWAQKKRRERGGWWRVEERKGNKDSYLSDIENEVNEGPSRNNKRELSLLVISHPFKSKALTKNVSSDIH